MRLGPIIKENTKITKFFSVIFGEEIMGLTIFPYIFIKTKDTTEDDAENNAEEDGIRYDHILNHEKIHYEQYKETLVVGYIIIYIINFFINLLYYRNINTAYRNILLEREAYEYMDDLEYLQSSKCYSWLLKY